MREGGKVVAMLVGQGSDASGFSVWKIMISFVCMLFVFVLNTVQGTPDTVMVRFGVQLSQCLITLLLLPPTGIRIMIKLSSSEFKTRSSRRSLWHLSSARPSFPSRSRTTGQN